MAVCRSIAWHRTPSVPITPVLMLLLCYFFTIRNHPRLNKRTARSSDHHLPLRAHIEANLQAN